MSLVAHAEYELKKAGLFDKDSDYDGEAGRAILEVVKVFSSQGHSGGSAWVCLGALEKLLRFQPLTPLTSDPDEWMCVSEEQRPDRSTPVWQSRRRPSTFSRDGGKTWYDLDDATQNNGDSLEQVRAKKAPGEP
jgi:hypothetical protein